MSEKRNETITDEQYQEIADKFRNEHCKDPTAKVKHDPSREYKKVIMYDWDPLRINKYEDKGWRIEIQDTEGRLAPVTGILPRSGKRFVYMSCSKEQRNKNELQKAQKDESDFIRATGAKIKRNGKKVDVILPEVDNDNK